MLTAAATRVSVIICAYTEERWSKLVEAVRSVDRQTVSPAETVVVIDHNAALFQHCRESLPGFAPGTRVRVVPNRGRRGLSGARNSGIAAARHGIVAFLDDDARAAPDWLERLLCGYGDPEVVGVGGQVVPQWEDRRPSWFPPEFDWVVGCTYRGVRSDAGPVRNFIGANMSFRSGTVRELGGFRSDLGRVGKVPLGCEETELCIRARRDLGGQLLYRPDALVYHSVPRTRSTWSYFRSRCYAEGLSKAKVSSLADPTTALESERQYVRHVLPEAVMTSFGEALRGSPTRLARAGAIVAGTAITGAGYVVGSRARGRHVKAQRSARRDHGLAPVVSLAFLALALGLWVLSLRAHVALSDMSDLGLLTVMPVAFWLGLVAVTVAFALAVTGASRVRWLAPACVASLVAMLHATPSILYGTLRYSWAWKHVAVVDYIQRHGQLDLHLGQLSAYQAWPGFFAMSAMFNQAGGLASSLQYASWAPVVFEAAFLAPLLVIFRQFTQDRRLVWTAAWFFYLGNWIGQDYFSPQATAYFLYLVVIAVVLRYVLPPTGRRPSVGTASLVDAPERSDAAPGGWALMTFFALVIAGIATIHQLTPLMLLSGLAFLWVFRQRLAKRWLILAAGITVGWVLIAARSFLASNLYWIIQSIGHPDANATSTLVNLSKVTSGQALVAKVDRLLSASLWGLAVVGLWRRRGMRKSDRPFLLLALSPLPLIVANDYGGEMLFRVYFFGLPFVALFAASGLFPSESKGHTAWAPISVLLVAGVLLGGFAFSYYGKEQVNYFSPQEVAAGQWVYQHAPPGSLLVSVTSNWPYSYQHFESYEYQWLALDDVQTRLGLIGRPIPTLSKLIGGRPHPGIFLVFSRAQNAEVAALGLMPPGSVDRLEQAARQSPLFQVAFSNSESMVLRYRPVGQP